MNAFCACLSQITTLDSLYLKSNYLSGHAVEALIQGLKSNISITKLSMPSNFLKDKDLVQIASLLSENTPLRILNISSCGIKNPTLQFTKKGVKPFSRALSKNSTLQILNLSHNYFNDEACVMIFNALAKNHSLQMLDFSDNFAIGNSERQQSTAAVFFSLELRYYFCFI